MKSSSDIDGRAGALESLGDAVSAQPDAGYLVRCGALLRSRSDYLALALLFVLSLAFLYPTMRGDGVAYYAYVRSLVIDGDIDFRNEYATGNPAFLEEYRDEKGNWRPELLTRNGYIMNRYAVGPALLWSPFFFLAHGLALGLNAVGAAIPADGYSPIYLWLCALGSALYAFIGLLLSYALCARFFSKKVSLLAVATLWFASSLPVYMYLLPFMAHAHSVFIVSLFLYLSRRPAGQRTPGQWAILGATAGLMVSVYYLNVVFLLFVLVEVARWFAAGATLQDRAAAATRIGKALMMFCAAAALALAPLVLIKYRLYGSLLNAGYENEAWYWTAPKVLPVLFSSYHGLFTWTPVTLLAVVGLALFASTHRQAGACAMGAFALFVYLVSSYQFWHGASSFGNRFFLSFTPLFILGLAALYESATRFTRKSFCQAVSVALVLWNALFIFQWGSNMISKRRPIVWSEMIYNQIFIAPQRIGSVALSFFLDKSAFYEKVEKQDYDNFVTGKDAGRWVK